MGGGGVAPPVTPIEASVVVAKPLVVKPVHKGDLARLLQGSGQTQWRIDKLGNRISYDRTVQAIKIFTSTDTDGVAGAKSAKSGKKQESKSAKNKVRPADEIVQAVVGSLAAIGDGHRDAARQMVAAAASSLCLNQFGMPQQGTGSFAPGSGPNEGMNASQMRAIAAATSQRLTLVQGPPGTGKTAVSVRILTFWARSGSHGRGGALAASDSNIAVDNILEGLAKNGVRVVRVGRPESTRPDLLRYSVDEIANQEMGLGGDGGGGFGGMGGKGGGGMGGMGGKGGKGGKGAEGGKGDPQLRRQIMLRTIRNADVVSEGVGGRGGHTSRKG